MTTSSASPGSVVQAWLPHPLDEQLRKYAQAERRSLSSTIRLAIQDQLETDFAETRSGGGQAPGGRVGSSRPSRGAGSEGER